MIELNVTNLVGGNIVITTSSSGGGGSGDSHSDTRVYYGNDSGHEDWSDEIVGELGQDIIPNVEISITVDIGNTVTRIGDNVFTNCVYLTNVTIPSSVTSIGDSAFFGCERLDEVTINRNRTDVESMITDAGFGYKYDQDWNYETFHVIIHCLDGNITIN